MLLLSIKNTHIAVKRTSKVQVQMLCCGKCSPWDSEHILLKNIHIDFKYTQCRLFIAL